MKQPLDYGRRVGFGTAALTAKHGPIPARDLEGMDTTPPIPPVGSCLAAPVPSAVDKKLLKRARYAGRNLSVLAVMATFGAMALIAAAVFAKGIQGVTAVLATTISLIAAGYWVLAMAARRGNPNAVGVVIVTLVLQICLALISSGVAAARTNSAFQPPVGGVMIPILVLVALASSRKVLLELREQGLWDQVFGSAKPSGNLCLIGGTLLATGFVAMNAGTCYIGWKAGQQQTAEVQHAKAFVELIQGDEKRFLTATQGISVNPGENIETALTKFQALEQNFEALKKKAASADRLLQILTTYGNALRQWKNGLMLSKEPNADRDRAQKMFKLGDQLRAEACQEFDRRYAPKKPEPGI